MKNKISMPQAPKPPRNPDMNRATAYTLTIIAFAIAMVIVATAVRILATS